MVLHLGLKGGLGQLQVHAQALAPLELQGREWARTGEGAARLSSKAWGTACSFPHCTCQLQTYSRLAGVWELWSMPGGGVQRAKLVGLKKLAIAAGVGKPFMPP